MNRYHPGPIVLCAFVLLCGLVRWSCQVGTSVIIFDVSESEICARTNSLWHSVTHSNEGILVPAKKLQYFQFQQHILKVAAVKKAHSGISWWPNWSA